MAAVGSAAGIRAWLASRGFVWLTPGRMRFATASLLGIALLAASVGFSGA